ncbi:MAG: DUF4864 domain-containing protein [Verrucomicrobiota bacterium]
MKFGTRVAIVVLTLGACALAAMVQIQERAIEREPVPSELFDVVQAGILALRAQHYQQAYLQASSHYQDRFNLDRFIEMARADCVSIRQAVRWEFGVPKPDGPTVEVPVNFFLQPGEVLQAAFTLVRENRSWKIEHVKIPLTSSPPRTVGGIRL